MRTVTPTAPTLDATDFRGNAQSALRLTREAIARWTGGGPGTGARPRDGLRISPQARHIAEARQGLETWIARGGFSQEKDDTMPLTTPVMFRIDGLGASGASCRNSDLCVD
jgi:hypothetical protein